LKDLTKRPELYQRGRQKIKSFLQIRVHHRTLRVGSQNAPEIPVMVVREGALAINGLVLRVHRSIIRKAHLLKRVVKGVTVQDLVRVTLTSVLHKISQIL
jgi:hypothetical protein